MSKSNRMPSTKPRIALVIPAYNEAGNLRSVLQSIDVFQRKTPHWEILPIVVDDASPDNTQSLLKDLSQDYAFTSVVLPVHLGIGGAVKTGFSMALWLEADVIVQVDGDGQHPAHEISKIVDPVVKGLTDVAVGSRYVKGGGGIVSSFSRRLGTGLFSLMLRVLAGVRILDCTSGFRAFNREAAELICERYGDDYPEVAAYALLAKAKFRIIELPVLMKVREKGNSSITPLKSLYYVFYVGMETLLDSLRPVERTRSKSPKIVHTKGRKAA